MKTINSTAYEWVDSIGGLINQLQCDTKLPEYLTPFTPQLYTIPNTNVELNLFNTDDVAFVNTSEFTKTRDYFKKYGVYTKAHPRFDSKEYNSFWEEEEKRCKFGMTAPGKLHVNKRGEVSIQKLHITGEHYGYLNYGIIKRSKDFEQKAGVIYDSNGEPLHKVESGTRAKEFDFPSFWDGDYYFFKAMALARKEGKHLVVGKARRKGYSYKNGWIVANKANLYRNSTSVVGAYDAASLFDDGTMVKVLGYLDFMNLNTDWNKRRLHNTLEHIEIGYRLKGQPEKRGYLSNIYTAILKTNPGGMRGKDADLLILEEAGKCPNLITVLDATLKTLTDGKHSTGTLVVFGTGGGDDNYWAGFEEIFYAPYSKNFLMFNNVFDEDLKDTGCGFFHSCYMSRPGLIDMHGNSDIKGAILDIEREKLVLTSQDKIVAYEMEEPSCPSQAFSRVKNNIFPTKDIDSQLQQLLHNPIYKGIGREGIFTKTNKGIIFYDRLTIGKDSQNLIPPALRNYPLTPDDKDMTGCWVLYDQPYIGKDGKIPDNLYHVWHDPFAISKEKSEFKLHDSLGGAFIYEAPNNFTSSGGDVLVAEYFGRTEETDDYNEQLFNAVMYYNAKMLFENDRGDVKPYAKQHKYMELLKDEPTFQNTQEVSKGGAGRGKGISIATNAKRKANGLMYLRDWLLSKRGVDANDKIQTNITQIKSIRLLKELLKFSGEGNFDAISTMIIGMYDTKELLDKNVVPKEQNNNQVDLSYFLNPFD
jgi:hypothetical protein